MEIFFPFSLHLLCTLATSERTVTAKSIQSDCLATIMKRFYPDGSDFLRDDNAFGGPQA